MKKSLSAAHAMTITLLAAAVLLGGMGCNRSKTPYGPKPDYDRSFNLEDSLTLSFGETAISEKENISIRFDSLLEDSRCPIDVICFWEGNARLSFFFEEPAGAHRFALNTYSGFTRDTLVSSYHISLIDVLPRPVSGREIDQKDYKAIVMIE